MACISAFSARRSELVRLLRAIVERAILKQDRGLTRWLASAGYKGASDMYIDTNVQLAIATAQQVGPRCRMHRQAAGRTGVAPVHLHALRSDLYCFLDVSSLEAPSTEGSMRSRPAGTGPLPTRALPL